MTSLRDWLEDSACGSEHLEALLPALQDACKAVAGCLLQGGTVLVAGNGGSAADAQHFAAELVGRFRRERAPMPAVALTTDSSCLTSIANDYGYDSVFARQVEALGRPGDVLVAISTSGRSANVLRAVEAAVGRGMTVVALTGADGGGLAHAAHVALCAPGRETAHVQEWHGVMLHAVCEFCEDLWTRAPGVPVLRRAGVLTRADAAARCALCRECGISVAFTNGCFDLLHAGHLATFEHARALADCLVVGVNSDDSVRALKGSGRPVVSLRHRVRMLAALECVDAVVVFEEATPLELIKALRPDVLVKGADYAEEEIVGAAEVRSWGGRVERVPLVEGVSTSRILEDVFRGRARAKGD